MLFGPIQNSHAKSRLRQEWVGKTDEEVWFVRLKPEKSNFETDNEKIFNVTELAMLRVMTMMTGELDATDLLLNFSDFNFRNNFK